MMKIQGSDIDRNKLIEDGKRIVLAKLLNKMKVLIIIQIVRYQYVVDVS